MPIASRKANPRNILLALLLLGAGGYAAIYYDVPGAMLSMLGGDQGKAPRAAAAAPVRVGVARTDDVPVIVRTIGTVLANNVVNIKSQIDGPLESVGFKEGQMVKTGDLLFRIDPAPFEAALRQAQAMTERDKAQLASAQADAERAMMLADRGIVSTQQRDQLVATAKALAATILADEANTERAKLNLGYTVIRSPINGKTGPYIVNPGNQVHANDVAGLVTITQIQPVKISFNLPQGDLPQLQARMNENQLIADVSVRSDSAIANAALTDPGDKGIPVKIDFIGNTVDNKTGTIELRATFANPDLRLVPGELVDVGVTLETLRQTVVVPRDAVNVGQDGNYIFAVDSANKAQMRPVKVLYQDQAIAALASGVQAGERVITDGQLRVTPGAAVSVLDNPTARPSNAAPAAQVESPVARRDPAPAVPAAAGSDNSRRKTEGQRGAPS